MLLMFVSYKISLEFVYHFCGSVISIKTIVRTRLSLLRECHKLKYYCLDSLITSMGVS
jgi:hypothetical protein